MQNTNLKTPEEVGEAELYNFVHKQEVSPDDLPSPVLARLINEVRNEEQLLTNHAYNRFHNRHNR